MGSIFRGDYFGESQELKVPGINYFGDVIADDDEVTCLFIESKDVLRIPIYELEVMRGYCNGKLQSW